MSTKQQKPTTELTALRVLIPQEVDAALERQIAGTKTTKRAFVEMALRKALKFAA